MCHRLRKPTNRLLLVSANERGRPKTERNDGVCGSTYKQTTPTGFGQMSNFYYCLFLCVSMFLPLAAPAADARGSVTADYDLFARTNLFAWCIVPFDARKRGPEDRAAMLEKLGFRLFAYDYRAEHVPSFDAEMEALQ